MRSRSIAMALSLLLASGAAGLSPALARPAPAVALTPADKVLVDKAAGYLQGLKSAEARFSQTDPRGAVTTGVFSLLRPGRARFAYDPPADLTVVADGVNLNVYDGKLKTFDQYPLAQTPLALLLGSEVRFDRSVVIAGVSRDQDRGFTVSARDAKAPAQGQLSLHFSDAPMALTGWTVIDAQGGKTTVRLSGLKTGVSLSPGLFVLRDPHPHTIKP